MKTKITVVCFCLMIVLFAGCAAPVVDRDNSNSLAGRGGEDSVRTLFFRDSSDNVSDLFSDNVYGDVAETGIIFADGNMKSTIRDNAEKTKPCSVRGVRYDADYLKTYLRNGHEDVRDGFKEYCSYDVYTVKESSFSAGFEYLSGTDVLIGYTCFFTGEEDENTQEISIDEAKKLCEEFIARIMRIDPAPYELILETDDPANLGAYSFIYSRSFCGIPSNDSFVVTVSKQGYVTGMTGPTLGISEKFEAPGEHSVTGAIESVLRHTKGAYGESAADPDSKKLYFSGDGKVYIAVKVKVSAGSNEVTETFNLYRELEA